MEENTEKADLALVGIIICFELIIRYNTLGLGFGFSRKRKGKRRMTK